MSGIVSILLATRGFVFGLPLGLDKGNPPQDKPFQGKHANRNGQLIYG
jgi:hypothetical protein